MAAAAGARRRGAGLRRRRETSEPAPGYTGYVRAEEVRRWVAGRQAAEAREREEARQNCPSPGSAMSLALGLIALAGRLHGWPLPEDEDAHRDDLRAYQAWARLRAAVRRHAPAR